ncbi:Uncharacterized protein LW94_3409 [Fusarium fujikuroi]|nr:Uncharacterized protein LW93_7617 [Fusarium fujikuroi]KLP09887.1 Uncharacterized protein Y057_6378 [Fusarium fujikuroi]KLP17037.1 Uncharacterized protein LW94_3409 [Fusarium fujikuroi]
MTHHLQWKFTSLNSSFSSDNILWDRYPIFEHICCQPSFGHTSLSGIGSKQASYLLSHAIVTRETSTTSGMKAFKGGILVNGARNRTGGNNTVAEYRSTVYRFPVTFNIVHGLCRISTPLVEVSTHWTSASNNLLIHVSPRYAIERSAGDGD